MSDGYINPSNKKKHQLQSWSGNGFGGASGGMIQSGLRRLRESELDTNTNKRLASEKVGTLSGQRGTAFCHGFVQMISNPKKCVGNQTLHTNCQQNINRMIKQRVCSEHV